MARSRFNTKLVGPLAIAAACWAVAGRAAEVEEVWEGQPYRIHALLAIDAPGDLAEQLSAQLPAYLRDRASASIGIVWRLKTELAAGPLRQRLLRGVDSFTADDLADATPDEDKRLLVSVRATPWGYELAAREFDRHVQRWGTTIRRTTRQRDALTEQLFTLVRRAVAPLAHVRPDPTDPQLVVLELRGSALPRSGPDFAWAEAGDVFLPMLRRTTRDGVLLPNGATVVPWTYLEVVKPSAAPPSDEQHDAEQPTDATQLVGRLRSATQRPLGVRRGRIEQVAVALRADPGESIVHLQSRTEPDKPLVGYEVFAQNMDEKPMRAVGESNDAGEVRVGAGKTAVQMLFVKSGGVYLARLPLVPGADQRVEVPLPDDDVRLRAAARLAAFREDLVDLVARRNIFMARVRQEIEEKDFARARELLESLDELPGPTQFNRTLDREVRLHRTNDLQVQRRIDQLFSQTRTALGKFLDPRPVSELYEELRQAEGLDKQANSKRDKETS